MKATVSRGDLAAALTAMGPAIPLRPVMPVLSAVVLTVTGSTMQLLATNLDTTIERSIPTEPGEDGTVLVSGLRLRDLVSKFASNTVDLTFEGDGVVVTNGRSTYRLATLPASEYPQTPKRPNKTGTVTSTALAFASRAVAHATKGDLEEVTLGMILEVHHGRLWVAASDRFRIAIQPIAYTGEPFRVRVLKDTLTAVAKNMAGDIDLHVGDSVLCLRTNEASITVRLLDGDGIPWLPFLQVAGEHPIQVNVDDFTGALERLSLVLGSNRSVRATVADGLLSLTGADPLADGVEEIDVDGVGTPQVFGFNPDWMKEFLACVDSPTVQIGTRATPTKPIPIKCLDADGEPSDAVHIVMPLRLEKDTR